MSTTTPPTAWVSVMASPSKTHAASTANITSDNPTSDANRGWSRAMPMMPSVYAIAVGISANAMTGTNHDVVQPATTAEVVVKVSGITPVTPRTATATAPTTRPAVANVIGLSPSPSVATDEDMTK